ncbi:MAG: T9SS type A sorting domain-containing protein [Crocinitomicaceae bacterium]
MKKIYTLVACICLTIGVTAQTTNLGSPLGWNGKLDDKNIPVEVMPGYDQDVINAEDAINDQSKDAPWRFGYKYDVNYTPQNSGNWTTLPNGNKVWQLAIECDDAMTINLLFDDYDLPKGAYLYLYDVDKTNRVGAYTSRNNRADGELGTELVHGDKIIVEYVEPANVAGQGNFTITNVIHGYRSLDPIQKDLTKALNSSGDCNIDVNCPLGAPWGDQIRSVAMIVVSGNGICTGALINNTCDDGTAYFLTANHCLGGGTGSWAFRFNWETPPTDVSCATTSPSTDPGAPYDQTANGATVLVSGTQADHALLQIDNMTVTDAENWNCFYAGWDNSDALTVTSAVGIHHPSGDVKKICEEQNAPYHNTASGAAVWYIDEWEEGVTEPGSSGSPLFDQNGRIIGQLYGGAAACSGTSNNGSFDYYGRLGVSWPLGIDTYLAPSSCGSSTTNDGWDPNSPSLPDDGGISAVISPVGLNCSSTFTPEVTIKNNGTNTLTSATINYDVDAGANQTFSWTGSLAAGASENVVLPAMSATAGAHTFNASTSLPNGNADSNTGNDASSSSFTTMANGQPVTLELNLDCYGDEITWEIQDVGTNTIISGGPYVNNTSGEMVTVNTCLDPGCYDFIINDSYGDGMYGSQWGGCTIDGDYTITQDNTASVLATIQAVDSDFGNQEVNNFCVVSPCTGTLSSATVEEDCFGDDDGSITVTVTGGDAPFSYDIGSGAQGSGTFSGLTQGSYTVTVTDNSACVSTIDVVLGGPTQLTASSTLVNETCPGSADGSIVITEAGGTAPYSYSNDCNVTSQATGTFSGLGAGAFCLITEDANGCQVTENVTLTTGTGVSATTTVTDISCNGLTDGAIQVVTTNGTAPFTYDIGSGAQGSDTFTNLGTGTFTIDIVDANGCTGQTSGTVTEPTALSASSTTTDEIFGNDGSIDLTVSGGTAPYTYSWTGPNGYTSTVEDPSGLESGDYTVTITDANGCTFQRDAFVDSQLGMLENGFSFTIYPNPSNGLFNVQLLNSEDKVDVSVVDVTGRIVLIAQTEGQSLFTVDLTDKAEGTYFLRISSGDFETTKKIVHRK